MRTRNAEIQRVAVATVVSDQRAADACRWTKASAIAIALLTYHGGLTPAALVNLRSCIAKIVILSADGRRSRNKSGGRKPPVGNKTPLQIATAYLRRYAPAVAVLSGAWPGVANCNRFSATTCVRATRSGWRKPAVVSRNALAAATSQLSRRGDPPAVCTRTPLQLRYHGGLTPVAERKRPQSQLRYSHPRRADARRSWERAFVHRKNRFSPTNTRAAPRAGGVSPPWETKHRCKSQPHSFDDMRLRRLLLLLLGPVLQIATAFLQRPACVQPGAAGVSQPWFQETHLQRQHRNCRTEANGRWSVHEHRCNCVTHTHGGLTPAALVNVRFVHRKNRFFAGKHSHCNVRAGGVNPPWDVLGMRTRNAEIQRVAVATVVSDQRRANAGR
jgi:hypothetical protein